VLNFSDRKSQMSSAATLADATRSALGLLVEREERRVGSRDVAFENVAQSVGSSASWVRKFIGRSDEVKEPRMTLFLNIRAAYEQLCNRVEQEHQNELAKIALLKKEIDEATRGFAELVEGTARAEMAGKDPRSGD
jgi:hypothetical protein